MTGEEYVAELAEAELRFAILVVATLVYLVGSAFGWWHADIFNHCDPYTTDCG